MNWNNASNFCKSVSFQRNRSVGGLFLDTWAVFTYYPNAITITTCVVDDFGNLVKV